MRGLYAVCLMLVMVTLVLAADDDSPNAESKGAATVETGDSSVADVKMSSDAKGKNVKSSTKMQASSSKNKGGTKGEAKTEVKN